LRKIIEFGFLQKKVSTTAKLFPTGLSGMFITDKGTVFVDVFLDIPVSGASKAAVNEELERQGRELF
jgi:hypothetical protein